MGRSRTLMERDLFGKPVSTFPDHALPSHARTTAKNLQPRLPDHSADDPMARLRVTIRAGWTMEWHRAPKAYRHLDNNLSRPHRRHYARYRARIVCGSCIDCRPAAGR